MTKYVIAMALWTMWPAAVLPQTPSAQATAKVDALAWLSGCWSMTRPDGMTEEHWMKPAGGSMLGMSRTVRGARTTEFEFLQIREQGDKLVYIAKPSGQAEASFPSKSITDREVVFENPTHDFPQRIIYRKTPEGRIAARVEGTMNGQPRGFDLPFGACAK
jgi:Domain of unknown function (DUF6265)